MARVIHTIQREADLVDFLTPRPVLGALDVLNEIRWEGGANFDVMNPLFTMPVPLQDHVDVNLTAADRQGLPLATNSSQLRVTFKPSTYGITSGNTFWLRRIVRVNGVDQVDPARYMMAPRRPTPRATYVIAGTAPSLASVADSLQLELPASMTSVSISVTSGSNLAIALDSRDAEQLVVASVPEKIITGTVSTLYIRGVGGASVFDITLSKVYA